MARLEEMTELVAWEKLSVFTPTFPLKTSLFGEGVEGYVAQAGYDPEYGVRELRRTVERFIQIPLSNLILSGELSKHPSWQVVCSDKGLSIVPI